MFILPNLPYAFEALEPVISGRTLHVHHDKHHAAYVKALNEQLEPAKSDWTLETVIRDATKTENQKLFNSAAQVWNHSFFWLAMSPKREQPAGAVAAAIEDTFGGYADLKKAFVDNGVSHFGSGWVWLVADQGGRLLVRSTHDADDTLTHPGMTPLLVCDLWEHAYYLDYKNDRKGFLEAWFDALPNWHFAAEQYAACQARGEPWRNPLPAVEMKKFRAG
jgi:superoxide dismutase, Fe-Mn family